MDDSLKGKLEGIEKALKELEVELSSGGIVKDQNLFARLGDFVQYDQMFFEIVDIFEPRYLFGQDHEFADQTSLEVTAVCRQVREGVFNPGKPMGGHNRRIT